MKKGNWTIISTIFCLCMAFTLTGCARTKGAFSEEQEIVTVQPESIEQNDTLGTEAEGPSDDSDAQEVMGEEEIPEVEIVEEYVIEVQEDEVVEFH